MTRQFRGSSLGKLGLQRWRAPFLTSHYNLISCHQIFAQFAPELVSFSPEFVSFSPGYFLFFIKNITEVVSYQPLEFGWPKSCFFFGKGDIVHFCREIVYYSWRRESIQYLRYCTIDLKSSPRFSRLILQKLGPPTVPNAFGEKVEMTKGMEIRNRLKQ